MAAHPAFTTDFDAILNDATAAAKEAIKNTLADQWRPGGDVEGLYEWNWHGDFSKSGATLEFTITVYLTPLETEDL